MSRSQAVLECEFVFSKQLLSRRKQKMLQDFLIDSSSDICLQKTVVPTPAADIPPQTMVLCLDLMLDSVQPGLSAS